MLRLPKKSPYFYGTVHNFGDERILTRKRVLYPGSPLDRRTFWREGSNIFNLALRAYGDSRYYYAILDVNTQIFNPFNIAIGTEIVIPDLETYKAHQR